MVASRLYEACVSGRVKLYRERANGTYRHLKWLRDSECEYATYMRAVRELGFTIDQIARDCGMSRSTVVRYIEAIDLQDAIAAGDYDEFYQENLRELVVR